MREEFVMRKCYRGAGANVTIRCTYDIVDGKEQLVKAECCEMLGGAQKHPCFGMEAPGTPCIHLLGHRPEAH